MLSEYGKASGAKINIQKSKAMAVGMWDTTLNILRIMYHENMKILGIHFTSTASQSAPKSWSVVADALRTQAREPCYRELSLNKLIHFVDVSKIVNCRNALMEHIPFIWQKTERNVT